MVMKAKTGGSEKRSKNPVAGMADAIRRGGNLNTVWSAGDRIEQLVG
jgi:hypothetical protein